jgi:hypothetical protein
MQLNLRKFDMASIPDDNVIVMIGKRNTGKSVLVKDLLYYKQDLPAGAVISGTEGANEFYSKIVPPVFIHEEFKPGIVSKLLSRQRGLIERIKEGEVVDPRVFFIMDDCMYDHSWTRDKGIRALFMNGRHWKILYIITMQYPLGIPPNLRTNIDYVFILRENYRSNRERIYKQFAGMFPSFEAFCQIMDQCTENYECLVIHNNSKSNKLEDQVFWYKADMHEDFRIGNDRLWRFNNQHLNRGGGGHNQNINQFDPSQFHSTRRGPSILVKKDEF